MEEISADQIYLTAEAQKGQNIFLSCIENDRGIASVEHRGWVFGIWFLGHETPTLVTQNRFKALEARYR